MEVALLSVLIVAVIFLMNIAHSLLRLAEHHERFPPPYPEPEEGVMESTESEPT